MVVDVKPARELSVSNPCGGRKVVINEVCAYWLAGRCTRNPCRFMHRLPSETKQSRSKFPVNNNHSRLNKKTWRNPNYHSPKNGKISTGGGDTWKEKSAQKTPLKASEAAEVSCEVPMQKVSSERRSKSGSIQKAQPQQCKYWVTGNCIRGDNCENLHAWSYGSGFTMLTKLHGHRKCISGVALPSGSDKLYTGSMDKSLCVWDCHSGQCTGTFDLGDEVGCLVTEGPWLFAGLPNTVKAWNLQAQSELSLSGPVGQVHSLVGGDDALFAGTEDGTICAWKAHPETGSPELVATLKGHTDAVCSLVVGAKRLYSGSKDGTVRVWDLETLQCLQTLREHSKEVTSVLCWDSYLLSASLDNTIKVWAATESGALEVVYELKEECGFIALCGITDAEARPILLCSCSDNTVRLYDLPSFNERGRIFAQRNVEVIEIGCEGLFFTGDGTEVFVWKLLGEPCQTTS